MTSLGAMDPFSTAGGECDDDLIEDLSRFFLIATQCNQISSNISEMLTQNQGDDVRRFIQSVCSRTIIPDATRREKLSTIKFLSVLVEPGSLPG